MPRRLEAGRRDVHMRWDPDFRDRVLAAARSQGMTLSDHLRELAAADMENRPPARSRAALESLVPAARQLRGAGRNLNRLVMLLEIARQNPTAGVAALANDPEGSLATAIAAVEEAAGVLKERLEGW